MNSVIIPIVFTLAAIMVGLLNYEDNNTEQNRRRAGALICLASAIWTIYIIMKLAGA